MMIDKRKVRNLAVLLCTGLLLLTACKDEALYEGGYGPEGEPVTINLKWSVPEMDVRSRAEMSDADAAKVNDLWVGIYNVATGECTYNYLYEGLSTTDEHNAHLLDNIETKSGSSYIVAVANAKTNFGISDSDIPDEIINVEGYDRENGDYIPLHLLLSQADTWQKYLSISSVLATPTNVDRFSADLVMNGVFHKSNNHDASLFGKLPEPIDIPAVKQEVDLGYIHLQRLISYNKFTIQAGEHITIEPISWQVHNNPVMSYLQEREGDNNSADNSLYFENREGYVNNHSISNPSYIFSNSQDNNGYAFDFYQYDNKQTAVKHAQTTGNDYVGINPDNRNFYADREREFKADGEGTNTGIYKSLCSINSKDEVRPKGANVRNFASYVTFRAKVSYYVEPMPDGYTSTTDGLSNEEDWAMKAPAVHENTSNAMLRTGNATYTIHLGYCEGKEGGQPTLTTAQDFHCRRNTKYDYTVTVNGLKNIVVEAINRTDEGNPGAEGDVTDAGKSQVIELDAHYTVFNIQLTNRQRTNLKWRISAPYGATTHTLKWLDSGTEGNGNPTSDTEVNRKNKFYNWIRFKPAPSEGLYAIYREFNIDNGIADTDLWTLEDLRDVENHPGIDEQGNVLTADGDDTTSHWYTVFVNEHVYEEDADETKNNWKNYVDIGDRTVWLNTEIYHESDDKESVYMQSQYMITQKSIQTYYNRNSEGLNAILGMEYENESYGLNLRWDGNIPTPNGTYTDGKDESITMNGWNADNGRWNEWYYLSTDHTIVNKTGKDWNGLNGILQAVQKLNGRTFIPRGVSPAIENRQNENKLKTYPAVYALQPFYTQNWQRGTDPTDTYEYYDILSVCMNRNRDLNGNGKIDKDELRWYLPASGKYLRMILGRHSMKTPLMDYDGTTKLPYGSGSANNARFHYATSDKIMLWVEEGVSTSKIKDNNQGSANDYSVPPWQVRCVRNLGVNLNLILNNDPVQTAYRLDEDNPNIVVLEYYDASSVRGAIRGHLQVHYVNSNSNMVARRFEYAQNPCTPNNTQLASDAAVKFSSVAGNLELDGSGTNYVLDWTTSVNGNQICGTYSQESDGSDRGTWRVPNQKELTIMRRLGICNNDDNSYKWMSCTQEFYPQPSNMRRFFGVHKGGSTVGHLGGSLRIRCVRDVIGQ